MIRGSMMRFPPPPAQGAKPRMWKSLGVIVQDQSGYVEGHYALDTFRGDYDIDTEADLRDAVRQLYYTLREADMTFGPDEVFMLQNTRRSPRVRMAPMVWGEPTHRGGRQ